MSRFFRVAPFDTGVFINTIAFVLALGFFVVRSAWAMLEGRFPDRFDFGAALILTVIVGYAWLRAVKGYTLANGEIIVNRTGPGKLHIATQNIESAEVNTDLGTFIRAGYLSTQGLFGWSGKAHVRKPTDVKSLLAEVYGTNHANSVVLTMADGRTVILTPSDTEGFAAALREAGIGPKKESYLRPRAATSGKKKRK